MEAKVKKELVGKSFDLVIKEVFVAMAIRVVVLAQSFFATVVNQAASNIEIERMKGEASLAFSKFVMDHQNSFVAGFTFVAFLLWLLAIYILFRDGNKILNLIKNGKGE